MVSTASREGAVYAIGVPGGCWAKEWPFAPPSRLVKLADRRGPDPSLCSVNVDSSLWAVQLPVGAWLQSYRQQPPEPVATVAVEDDPPISGIGEDKNLCGIAFDGGGPIENCPKKPTVPLRRLAAQDSTSGMVLATALHDRVSGRSVRRAANRP